MGLSSAAVHNEWTKFEYNCAQRGESRLILGGNLGALCVSSRTGGDWSKGKHSQREGAKKWIPESEHIVWQAK